MQLGCKDNTDSNRNKFAKTKIALYLRGTKLMIMYKVEATLIPCKQQCDWIHIILFSIKANYDIIIIQEIDFSKN